MLVAPAFTLLLSFVFNFSYTEVTHSAPYIICYFFYALMMTFGYVASLDEPNEPMSFI